MYRHAFEIKCKIDQQHLNTGRPGIREQRQHALVWRPFRLGKEEEKKKKKKNGKKCRIKLLVLHCAVLCGISVLHLYSFLAAMLHGRCSLICKGTRKNVNWNEKIKKQREIFQPHDE